MMKRISFVLAAVATALGVCSTAEAATNSFSDLGGSYAVNEINSLASHGILNGKGGGLFKPHDTMTREDLAVALTKALNLTTDTSAAAKFTDVDAYARPYVGALVNSGITSGTSNTTFGGRSFVTREQLAIFFVRAMGLENAAKSMNLTPSFSDRDAVDTNAQPYVAAVQKAAFIKGSPDGQGGFAFQPKGNAERQAVARLLYEMVVNQSTYKNTIASMQPVSDALHAMTAAIDAQPSYHIDVQATMAQPDSTTGFTLTEAADYHKSPLSMHEQMNMSMTNMTSTSETYIANGYVYMSMPDGSWVKSKADSNVLGTATMLSWNNDLQKASQLAPYLQVSTSNGETVISGTIAPADYSAAMSEDAMQYSDLKSVTYKYVLDATTNLIKTIDESYVDGSDVTTVHMAVSAYGTAPEVTVPPNVLATAQGQE